MEKEQIDLSISKAEIRKALENVVSGNHKDLVLRALFETASSEQLSALFKASIGIEPIIDYSVGDDVYVELYGISTWDFDIDLMKEKDLITIITPATEIISAKIVEINGYSQTPYTVEVEYFHKDHKPLEGVDFPHATKKTQDVSARYIKGPIESWPEGFFEGI